MPITQSLYGVTEGRMTPKEALEGLMNRRRKNENEDIFVRS